MAVMTSSAVDKVPIDVKAAAYAPADAMAPDSEANGVHDVLFDEPEPQPSHDAAPDTAAESVPPTVNGKHDNSAPAIESEPINHVSAGIEPVAPFIPDSQADMNSLFGESDVGAISGANTVEAPTSALPEDATHPGGAHAQDTSAEHVPETQLPGSLNNEDNPNAMDLSMDGQTAPSLNHDSPTATTNSAPTKPMTELTLETQQDAQETSELPKTESPAVMDQEMEDAPPSGKVRTREEDDDIEMRDTKRTKTESDTNSEAQFKLPEIPAHQEHTNGNGVAQVIKRDATAMTADQVPVQSAADAEEWPTTPMTHSQIRFLVERIRNTKKIKAATAFREPVNPDALGIPTYRTIVTNPMDLSTLESKLKEGRYSVVREFMEDLDLIIDNSVLFNGKEHPVTQAGYNMRAYFLKGMAKMPRGTESDQPLKQTKPKKPTVATSKVRRDSKPPATVKSPIAPPPSATSPQAAWPLTADGTPLIRRDSNNITDRPKREIHRPPPKDLPYNTAKPKKKKYQQELRFCESVLTEINKPKYQRFAYPFLVPVDPVALNIPSYLKIIKKPMDFGTIEKNLKAGQYQTAKDFYNDAQLVFQNCYKFNPEGDEVNRMGKELNALFDRLWDDKAEWLAQHAPASDPQSPGSAYSDEEEEEEEEEIDPAQAQILAIQRQIAQLNETAQSLLQQQKGKRHSPNVSSKKKSGKPPAPKKKHSLAVPPPPKPAKASKPRARAPAPLTFAQKQDISDGISTLGDAEMRKAVQIIRNGCPHLANVNDDEMEIDMDEIGDDTLRELYKYIKQVRGGKENVVDDDDFEPPKVSHKAATSKPKKNKPMGKKEQEESIRRIQDQLRNFEASGASGSSQSPSANQDESSDDESNESESEEE